jgi:3-dehydroquinate dehydratase-2
MPERRRSRARPAAPPADAPAGRAGATRTILVLSGPNLQLLGAREPAIYGKDTLAVIHARLEAIGRDRAARIDCRQSNHEGELCDWLGRAPADGVNGILINAGAYTHTSLALYDAIRSIALPTVEVHLSNPEAREAFRHESKLAPACLGKVAGFGSNSYALALRALLDHLDAKR